jgi:pimeloyl-ACP methyl ester carboxylesterase
LSRGQAKPKLEAVRQLAPPEETTTPPRPHEVDWKSLYRKSHYEVRTRDGWTLVVTRYQPLPQRFAQPVFGEPLLLVHGFSQNRHAWTSGGFVKQMLLYGADVHVLELRGHGLSSVELQLQKLGRGVRPPADIDYAWDIDSYFLEDVPAAVAAVKERSGRDTVFYCGHSLGGMLGYGYAGANDDLAGLVTIGAPADPGKGFLPLRMLAHLGPAFELAIDAAFLAQWGRTWAGWRAREGLRRGLALAPGGARLAARLVASACPERRRFRYYPIDILLRRLERALASPGAFETWSRVARHHAFIANPAAMTLEEIRWLLREGGEREPRRVVAQLGRWIRGGELRCYRTGYDFRAHFGDIRIPMAIIFGDLDPLASIESTKEVYRAARSEYLLWRPVKGNSHLELTMGRDVRQICFDVKNLIEFARKFPARRAAAEPARAEPQPRAEANTHISLADA